jgi:HD-GYP domain-containing protein (c-di-GMP phosphodiesterase class II)
MVSMRRVLVNFLREGMKVGRTIYNNKGEELLRVGVVLDADYIELLAKLNVAFVLVDDGVPFQLPEAPDVISRQTRRVAVAQIKKVLLDSKESGRLVIEPQSLYNTVGELIRQLLANQDVIFNLVDLRMMDDYLFAHSVNVCILSVMTGITLGYSRSDLELLGIGALLHDLGVIKMPDALMHKPTALTTDEWETIKMHPIYGYEIITEAGNLDEAHAIIALQHHENYDGSGYPLGISGDQFTEFAQIVSLADKFDAITSDRGYRKAYPPIEAYEMCEASMNYLVSESVARAFMYNIAAYPSNTVVELNNGMIGVTTQTFKGNSLFPLVKVYSDKSNRMLTEPIYLPLYKSKGLRIVKVLQSP